MTERLPNSDALALITQNQRALYGYILSTVFSRDIADEVLQETNVVLCRKIHEFDGRASFLTWACTIARYEVLAARKRRFRDRLVTIDEATLDQISEVASDEASTTEVRLPLLRQCMEELSEPQRQMIEDRYRSGGSVTSLAETMDRTPASVRVTLHRVRRSLLDCIEKKLTEGDAP